MRLSRRELLKLGLVGGGAALLPTAGLLRAIGAGEGTGTPDSPPVTPFSLSLPIPGIIAPVASNATTDFFEVRQVAARVEILPGLKTPVWAYNGLVPGPTFKVRRGRRAVVTQVNKLTGAVTDRNDGVRFGRPETGVFTSTHLHGGNVAARDDGNPVLLVLPTESFTHSYPNDQPATSLWYHDHALVHTGRNVYRGLAGFYLVTDDVEEELERSHRLPSGPFDIPLMLADKAFNRDGTLFFPTLDDGGTEKPLDQGNFGDVLLVNGAPQPRLAVQRRQYRFRLLNASNARLYQLCLSTGDAFSVVGTDGGLARRPVPVTDLLLAPAERYSVVVDFARYKVGTQVVLENRLAPDPFGDPVDPARVGQVMRFDVTEDADDPVHLPDVLLPGMPEDLGLPEGAAVRERQWTFEQIAEGWSINQRTFDAPAFVNGRRINFDDPADDGRVDAVCAFGTSEIWEFQNPSRGWRHPVHPHLVRFRVLSRNGAPPRPYEVAGRKDTVIVGPNEVVRVVMEFGDFDGRFVFHCHNLEHEDNDMMTQYRVVR